MWLPTYPSHQLAPNMPQSWKASLLSLFTFYLPWEQLEMQNSRPPELESAFWQGSWRLGGTLKSGSPAASPSSP